MATRIQKNTPKIFEKVTTFPYFIFVFLSVGCPLCLCVCVCMCVRVLSVCALYNSLRVGRSFLFYVLALLIDPVSLCFLCVFLFKTQSKPTHCTFSFQDLWLGVLLHVCIFLFSFFFFGVLVTTTENQNRDSN